MIRVLTFLIGVLALGAGLAWLADRPGRMVLTWQGYEVQTSLMAMMLALVLMTGLLILLWTIYRWIVEGPQALSDYFRNRRQVRGYEALSRGMIAVGAGDPDLAGQQARQARKLLSSEPLVALLTAQSAQLSGDRDGARKAFRTMLDTPGTALLGLHGLYVEAERQGDHAAAARFADEAVKQAPGLAWAAEAALMARVGEGNWDAALSRLSENHNQRLIDKAAYKRLKAVVLTAKAQTAEDDAPQEALEAAQEAARLAPDLIAASVIAGRLLASDGKTSAASALLEKAWRLQPHPDLAAVYAHARSGDSVRDRLKRVKMLAAKMSTHPEAGIAVANAAIEALDWAVARQALAPLIAATPSRRVCLLMAEIEDGENANTGKVREWFARAIRAPRDPAWVADSHVSDSWAPVSPVTGKLDAYVWKVPDEDVAPPSAAVLEADTSVETLGEDAPLLIDVTDRRASVAEPDAKQDTARDGHDDARHDNDDAPANTSVVDANAAGTSASTSAAGSVSTAASVKDSRGNAGGAGAEPAPAETPPTPRRIVEDAAIVPAHAPDDPGPERDEEPDKRKWFGLF